MTQLTGSGPAPAQSPVDLAARRHATGAGARAPAFVVDRGVRPARPRAAAHGGHGVAGTAGVPEPESDQHQQDRCSCEGGDGGVSGDHSDRGERVAVEEQAAERVTHEEGLAQSGEALTGLRGGCFRVGRALLDVLTADLGVRLSLRGLVHVDLDVVVGVGLGLRSGGQVLAGVLLQGCLVGSRKIGESGLGGRHRDVLLGELVVNLVPDEQAGPGEQTSSNEQDGDQEQSRP